MIEKYSDTQRIKQLEKRRGSYFHVVIPKEVVKGFPLGRKSRFICTMENELSFQCGLNHYGDGNFFIIINKGNLQKLGKILGDELTFELKEDPNPLGVEMPEVLKVLLDQDEQLKRSFNYLAMGKKRHIIHTIKAIKDIDEQVFEATQMINQYSNQSSTG